MHTPWNWDTLPAHIDYAMGVDGGGTSTRARVVHRSGVLVGEGTAGASGLMQGIAQAWRHIDEAIAAASHAFTAPTGWAPLVPAHCALGLGLAGANNAAWHAQCLQANPGYARVALASDAATALWGAHRGQPGALLIMGTGAVGLALDHDGQQRSSGGWGFPCGDEGSGAYLGLHAVRLTQQALDGRAPLGPLACAVRDATGGSAEHLLDWCCQAGQFAYASLAPTVFAHAAHDPGAAALLHDAAQHLEALVQAVDPRHTLPLVVAGSVGQRLVPQLCARTAARLVCPQGDAMDGALALCFS